MVFILAHTGRPLQLTQCNTIASPPYLQAGEVHQVAAAALTHHHPAAAAAAAGGVVAGSLVGEGGPATIHHHQPRLATQTAAAAASASGRCRVLPVNRRLTAGDSTLLNPADRLVAPENPAAVAAAVLLAVVAPTRVSRTACVSWAHEQHLAARHHHHQQQHHRQHLVLL